MRHRSRLCVGLLSGTSADGIDAAVVQIVGAGVTASVTLIASTTVPYPTSVRQELFALFEQHPPVLKRLTILHRVIGELFAEAAHLVCQKAGIPLASLFVIGSHGQTVWHQPEPDPSLPLAVPSTLQIGSPAVIALRTGVPVVSDFRQADIAAGGQGAPLVPYFDWVTLRDTARARAVQNIGGIANVTYLPPGGGLDNVLAFDTGPGTMVIDGLVQLLTDGTARFDRDGALAAAGRVDERLLAQLLEDPYLQCPPPKTTGRERYGLPFAQRLLTQAGVPVGVLADPTSSVAMRQHACDLVATATAFTAHSIALAYRRWLPPVDEIILCGGGSRNPVLVDHLRDLLSPVTVRLADEFGIDADAKEAMAFALLAHDACFGMPTNVPRATGASRAVTLGSLTLPTPSRGVPDG